MLPRKKWYTWTVLLRLVFLDKEYSSEVFQTVLAVPHFSKVAVAEVFFKKGVPENFANPRCFPVNFAKFSRKPFFIEHLRWLLVKSLTFQKQPPEVFYEKRFSWKFCKIYGKTLLPESLFYSIRPATLSKQSLWCSCFPVNFAKTFLRTPIFTEHLRWLLL